MEPTNSYMEGKAEYGTHGQGFTYTTTYRLMFCAYEKIPVLIVGIIDFFGGTGRDRTGAV